MTKGQTMVFNLCKDKLSSENLAKVQAVCKDPKLDTNAYAYHIEGTTCTVFNNDKIEAAEIPKKTDGTAGATANGGLSLTYAIKGS